MVDSPILDNQVIGNSYFRTSENRKTRYGKSHTGQTVAINNFQIMHHDAGSAASFLRRTLHPRHVWDPS